MPNYDVSVSDLQGKTLQSVSVNALNDEIVFVTTEGDVYLMYHSQSCCECVTIEDICGDLTDLVGSPLLVAEEVEGEIDILPGEINYGEYKWTFYKFDTIKGGVTIRWYGTSNGWYSISVSFRKED